MKFVVGILILLASCLNGCPSPVVPDAGPPINVIDSAPLGDAAVFADSSNFVDSAPPGDSSVLDASGPIDAAGDFSTAPPTCDSACAAGKAAGCPEGKYTNCSSVCQHELSVPGLPQPKIGCLSAAKSPADVRVCGWPCKLSSSPK